MELLLCNRQILLIYFQLYTFSELLHQKLADDGTSLKSDLIVKVKPHINEFEIKKGMLKIF